MTRWEALVRFDDEICEAAAQLIPFGPIWVAKLGEAFFALGEDRKYLPNIVAGLRAEAEIETRAAELALQEAERVAALRWLAEVSETASGEKTSKDSLAVLIELAARGYQIAREKHDGAISVGRDTGISYLRSNAEILGLGRILLRDPRS